MTDRTEAFEALVVRHRGELERHCYRLLGSAEDAEDAVQEALVAAWRGLGAFEGRSSLRTWLFKIATHAALRVGERRPIRLTSWDLHEAADQVTELGQPLQDAVFVEPLAASPDPASVVTSKESVRLAFVAALQHLPATQRAVLLLRDVLQFSAAEVAEILESTVPAVNSSLQRARASQSLAQMMSGRTVAQMTVEDWSLVDEFSSAWERSDAEAIVSLLSEDVRFTMPPLPAWFEGVAAVGQFLELRVFEKPWRLRPVVLNEQPAFLGYQETGGREEVGATLVLNIDGGRVNWIASFVDPQLHQRYVGNLREDPFSEIRRNAASDR